MIPGTPLRFARPSSRRRTKLSMVGSVGSRALAGLAAIVIGVTLAPPDANALATAERQAIARQVVLDAKRDAAKARTTGALQTVEDAPAAEPLAETSLSANRESTLESAEVGVTAEFSGHKVKGQLDVTLSSAPEPAAASAASEVEGQVIGEAVEITAVSEAGKEVTEFPAEVETVEDEHGVESAVNVTPGITLGFDVDATAIEQAGLDTATLKIYTREAEGDPWLELPSYFDAETSKVVGESDHLSQFVVIGKKYVPPVGPTIVLDPDDDYGWAETPSPASELPYNVALSNMAAAKLSVACLSPVLVTRQADVQFVSGATRAAIAASVNPAITVTIAFDAVTGSAWGTEADGGTFLYSRGGAGDALASSLVANMPAYTGRPAGYRAANDIFPDPAFSGIPGAMAHMETLYLDHNFDRAVIDNGFESVVNGAVVGIAKYAESLGYDCSDPARGGLPKPPTKAELDRWRHLGHQNYQTYGADPVSFSTGNLVEDEELFALTGRGEQALDFTLTYNSQDGRLSRIGAGWSFGLGGRMQRYDDGSALVVRGDGASFVFTGDGSGGYTGEDGLGLTLRDTGSGVMELRSDNGEIWKYDAADIEGIGELISHTDRQGNKTTLTYGAPNEDVQQFLPLETITDDAGQTVTVESDTAGRITALVHPDGRRWALAYDAAGNLTSITAPDGGVRSFTYDDEFQMLTATDAVGDEYLKNKYDSQGRVVKQWDADGNLRTFAYGDGTTKYTDAEGEVSTFTWDKGKRITRVQDAAGGDTRFTFDGANRVTKANDAGTGLISYTYDARGNVASETRPDGSVWKYTWTPKGELASSTDPLGRTTTHEVNDQGLTTKTVRPDGSVISYAYTSSGDLKSVTQPSGAVQTYAYDKRGNLVKQVTGAGRITTWAYDDANRVVSETDGTGSTIQYAYDQADNVVQQVDGLGNTTSYTYDGNGHVLTETAADGGVTKYAWDSLFRLAQVTDPEGGVTKYRYNKEDAIVGEVDPLGTETKYAVDPVGRVTAVTDPLGGVWGATLDPAGRISAETDPLGRTSKTSFDDAGQVVSQTDPEGGEWQYTYDAVGNLTSQTDPEGGTTSLTYDALDQLVTVTDADERVVEYAYDVDGGLIAVIDPAGETTGFTLDADGMILTSTDALGETTTFEYDAAGRATAVVDPLGARTEFGYDAAGQQTVLRDALGGESLTEYDPVGRVTAVVDPSGDRNETQYDLNGRMIATVDPLGAVKSYGYDVAGRQTTSTDADGRNTVYEYDQAGQLTGVVEGYRDGAKATADTNVRTSYEYTAAGELQTIIDPVGGKSSFEYDDAGRPIRQVDAAGAVSTVAYDRAGRVTTQANGAGQKLTTEYTKAGLVARTKSPTGTTTFEYDAAGRPVAMSDSQGATGWRYDKLGRMTSETSTTNRRTKLAYDAAGRVEQMVLPDGEFVDYSYDLLGRMTSQNTAWGDLGYEWTPDSLLSGISRGNGVHTSITSDAADRTTEVLHTEPAPKTKKKKEPKPEVSFPAQSPAKCLAGVDGYLGARNLQSQVDDQCVKTADYLDRRTAPAPEDPVEQGGQLRYTYGYSADGKVTTAGRNIESAATPVKGAEPEAGDAAGARAVLESLQSTYTYDGVGRLETSTVSDVTPKPGKKASASASVSKPRVIAESQFGYDASGNRTLAKTTQAKETVKVAQEFGGGNRLTKRTTTGTDADGTRKFGYDDAGRRVSETGAGQDASYEYDFGGQPTSTQVGGRETTTGYDGLGRAVTESVTTQFGTDTTAQSWAGGSAIERSSDQQGDTTLIWGVAGELAGIGTDTSDEARWALLDQLGSVVAEATGAKGADISQLATYSEYGTPEFESTGYAQFHGYTGQLQNGATGTVSFGARNYDPAGGTWFSPDDWPGLTTAPQSLNRYGYVLGDPVSLVDLGGYLPLRPNPYAKRYTNPSAMANHVGRPSYSPSSTVNPRTINPSALTNHVDNPNYFAATGRSLASGGTTASPQAISGPFMQERHRTATRMCQGSNPMTARACMGQNVRPSNWGQTGRWAGRQMTAANIALLRALIQLKKAEQAGQKSATDFIAANPGLRRAINLPITLLVLGIAASTGTRCDAAKNGLIVCSDAKWGYGGGGTTFGEVFVTPNSSAVVLGNGGLLSHEQRHSSQWASHGPLLFIPKYFNEALTSMVLNGGSGCKNWFERDADLKDGYYEC